MEWGRIFRDRFLDRNQWILIVIFALALVPIFASSNYVYHVAVLILLNIALSGSWNLIGGFAGQLSLGHVVFFGIGAYSSFILYERVGLSPWTGLLMGGIFSVLVAFAIGILCFRLKGPYFALATLAVGEIIRTIFLNWRGLTNGAEGIIVPELPRVSIPLLPVVDFTTKRPFYILIFGLAFLVVFTSSNVKRRKIGFYLAAIRGDEDAAESIGVSTLKYKLSALGLSSFFTSICGGFYAFYTGYIDPHTVLNLDRSIEMVLITIIGGIGTVYGPVLGAIVIVALSEILRTFFTFSHLLVYGILVILVILFMPRGLIGYLKRQS